MEGLLRGGLLEESHVVEGHVGGGLLQSEMRRCARQGISRPSCGNGNVSSSFKGAMDLGREQRGGKAGTVIWSPPSSTMNGQGNVGPAQRHLEWPGKCVGLSSVHPGKHGRC